MSIQHKTNIAILSIYSFPFGSAATNRIISYSKGMVEKGVNVDIFIPFPTERVNKNQILENEGTFQGINYYYTQGRYRNKFKILRIISVLSKFRTLIGYITSWKKIIKTDLIKNYDYLIISTDQIISLYIYSKLAKKINAKSIFIFDEFPIPIRHKLKTKIPIWKKYLFKSVLVGIDGYISISEELKNYYNKLYFHPTFVMPVIVDISRFNINTNESCNPLQTKNIVYMGNMELSKDNVDNIIRAFKIVVQKYNDIQLHLYGYPNSRTKLIINNLIAELSLKNNVFFKGSISSDKVPKILKASYILVSSQPNTIRAKGGFPTKMGEYLATGVPSLFTDVGENSKYVKDNIHIYFAKPDDYNAYAEKLMYIINNYDKAKNVALYGENYLNENFSHTKMGEKMLQFLYSIK